MNRPNPKQPNELTPREADRLVYLMAYGPADYRPGVDDSLRALGWIQNYDDTDAVEAIDGAEKLFYDPAGCIAAPYCPDAWRTERWEAQRYRALPLPPLTLTYDAGRPR